MAKNQIQLTTRKCTFGSLKANVVDPPSLFVKRKLHHILSLQRHQLQRGAWAEKETDRLDIMHKLTEVSLGGQLNLAPIPANAKRILDIGTGTGVWAIDAGSSISL
ncbi:MAG: hypothetical protein Q9205_001622 [Flavoplaca limonia]